MGDNGGKERLRWYSRIFSIAEIDHGELSAWMNGWERHEDTHMTFAENFTAIGDKLLAVICVELKEQPQQAELWEG